MGRTPSIALRLRGLVNWPGNVRHPFLANYVKHIFQHYEIAEPAIRASTTGIWINVTVLQHNGTPNAADHPKVQNQILDFHNIDLENALGHVENRIKLYTQGGIARQGTDREKPVDGHRYFKKISTGTPGHLLAANDMQADPLAALQLYKNVPIHLRVNVINNPLLDAQCLAHFIAKHTQKKIGNFQKVYKMLLQSLN